MNAAVWGSTLVWLDLCGLVLGTLCVWPGVAWRLEEGGARDNAHIIGTLGLYPPADRCLMPPELTTRYAVKIFFLITTVCRGTTVHTCHQSTTNTSRMKTPRHGISLNYGVGRGQLALCQVGQAGRVQWVDNRLIPSRP